MTRRKIIILSIALAAALFIAEVFLIKNITGVKDKKKVVYAGMNIAANTVISGDMLILTEVPGDIAHKLSFTEISAIIGKKARTDIAEGEMLLSTKIGIYGDLESIRTVLPGNRLICLDLKGDQANGWCIVEGQEVDILFVPDESKAAEIKLEPGTGELCVKLPSIRVAAVIDDKYKIIKPTDVSRTPKYLMVEVTPEQSEMLAYAKGNGRIEIATLRNISN